MCYGVVKVEASLLGMVTIELEMMKVWVWVGQLERGESAFRRTGASLGKSIFWIR